MNSVQRYFERNNWILYLFTIGMVVGAHILIKSMPEFGFHLPDMLVYIVGVIACCWLGFKIYVTDTVSARIAKVVILAAILAILAYQLIIWFYGK
ncbi:TPA: hypothetical protein JHK07_004709 [Escherichia coli]|nr:hypothetical protein [Escherichia coli]